MRKRDLKAKAKVDAKVLKEVEVLNEIEDPIVTEVKQHEVFDDQKVDKKTKFDDMKFSPALSFIVRACKADTVKRNRVLSELGLST